MVRARPGRGCPPLWRPRHGCCCCCYSSGRPGRAWLLQIPGKCLTHTGGRGGGGEGELGRKPTGLDAAAAAPPPAAARGRKGISARHSPPPIHLGTWREGQPHPPGPPGYGPARPDRLTRALPPSVFRTRSCARRSYTVTWKLSPAEQNHRAGRPSALSGGGGEWQVILTEGSPLTIGEKSEERKLSWRFILMQRDWVPLCCPGWSQTPELKHSSHFGLLKCHRCEQPCPAIASVSSSEKEDGDTHFVVLLSGSNKVL
ncbi:uncharacterized protein LOC114676224 [Macaca mulatta]